MLFRNSMFFISKKKQKNYFFFHSIFVVYYFHFLYIYLKNVFLFLIFFCFSFIKKKLILRTFLASSTYKNNPICQPYLILTATYVTNYVASIMLGHLFYILNLFTEVNITPRFELIINKIQSTNN